jgi:hypothetical protein
LATEFILLIEGANGIERVFADVFGIIINLACFVVLQSQYMNHVVVIKHQKKAIHGKRREDLIIRCYLFY